MASDRVDGKEIFMENFACYRIWADIPSNGEPLRLYEQEGEVIGAMLTGSSFNKLH